jgi:hypothetical protein
MLALQVGDDRKGWSFGGYITEKGRNLPTLSLRLDDDPSGGVPDPAADPVRRCQFEYKGPKADSLDDPFDFNVYSIDG